MKKLLIVLGIVALVLFGIAFQCFAQSIINACYDIKGNLRIVTSPDNCRKNETFISWNLAGIISPKRVFITSESYTGNLGGLEGADLKCQSAANNAGLGGVWKAWLSGGNRTDVVIAGRMSRHLGYYTKVKHPLWGLVGDPIYGDFPYRLYAGINMDEFGQYVGGQMNVWTSLSTYPTVGAPVESVCRNPETGNNEWTSDQHNAFGRVGSSSENNEAWQDAGEESCDQLNHLYCFEQ